MRYFVITLFLLFTAQPSISAEIPSAWPLHQEIGVEKPGLIRQPLPYETIDQAHATLRDLRLFDTHGKERTYLLEYPVRENKQTTPAKQLEITVQKDRTLLAVITGSTDPIEAVVLETPASDFLKAVTVEGSKDQKQWRPLAINRPVFRQPNGAAQLKIDFGSIPVPYLRMILDDDRTPPIPITGVRIQKTAAAPPATDPIDLNLIERIDAAGETYLRIALPSRNITLSEIELITEEALFTRPAWLTLSKYMNGEIQEERLAEGTFYRIAPEGKIIHANERLSVGKIVQTRELTLVISNGDAPPLRIKKIRAHLLPVYLIFYAQYAGSYHLAFGHLEARAPQYDLSGMRETITRTDAVSARIGSIQSNPAFIRPEPLPMLPDRAGPIDLTPYRYRARLRLSAGGIQELEPGLHVLSQTAPSGSDWRIVAGENQVPYVIERRGRLRSFSPSVRHLGSDPKKRIDRWELLLPYSNLPLTSLSCTVIEQLFERSVQLYEEREDERGAISRRLLGRGLWRRIPEQESAQLFISIQERPQTTKLILEVDYGDNSPLRLETFQFHYQAPRLLFKGPINEALWFYYGNPKATLPQYDISLIADALLSAERSSATLDQEESLKTGPSRIFLGLTGPGRLILWASLGISTAVLLFIIIKLLPPTSEGK